MLAPLLAATLILSGDIMTTEGHPVGGATVEWNASQKTISSPAGHFTVVPVGTWPADLTVSARGFGTVVVPVPHAHRNTHLPAIKLEPGATLRIHLHRGLDQHASRLRVGLLSDDARTRWILHRKLDEADDVVLYDLPPGAFAVLVDGSKPLQHAVGKAVVGRGDVRDLDMSLPARRSHLQIYRGDLPVANRTVQLESIDGQWQSSVATDADGLIDTPIWDFHGQFEMTVDSASSAVPVMRLQTLVPTATVKLPSRTIKGFAVDVHGKPIEGAVVSLLDTVIGDGKATVRARTDSQGRFAFEGLERGDQVISVAAPGYLFRDPERLTTDDLKVTLRQGYLRDLVIEQSDGSAVAGAEVLCVKDGKIRAKALSGADGHVTMATPGDEPSIVYVIPSDGSLAIRRFRAPLDEVSSDPVTIRIAPAASSLHVRTLTTRGTTVPNVNLLLRYNGELIPTPIAQELERIGDLQFQTDVDGQAHFEHIPTGIYELWPYNREEEMTALLDSIGVQSAPVVVNASAGENDVTIRLNARR